MKENKTNNTQKSLINKINKLDKLSLKSTKICLKKAYSLSLEIIVVAVILLIVMIVLIIIFTGKARPVADVYSDCAKLNGTVVNINETCPDEMPIVSPFYKKNDMKCCVAKFT